MTSKKEVSVSSHDCVSGVLILRLVLDGHQIRKQVKQMYSMFFSHTARQAINVDSAARAEADADVLDPKSTSFSKAETQVFNLMKDDSYTRFLKSEIFAENVRSDISRTQRKEYGIISWYKTSVKPRLSLSQSKTPASRRRKSTRFAISSPDLVSGSLFSLTNSSSDAQTGFGDKDSGCQQLSDFSQSISQSCASLHDKENVWQKSASTKNAGDGRDGDIHALDDFRLPDALWQLSDENEYEDFFCDLLSASQKYPDFRRKETGLHRRSNSQPSLADTIAQVTQHPPSSPGADRLFASLPVSSRTRQPLCFKSPPPPPLLPKGRRRVCPLPPPAAAATRETRDRTRVWGTMYV